jgi:hypothetical protein
MGACHGKNPFFPQEIIPTISFNGIGRADAGRLQGHGKLLARLERRHVTWILIK